MTRRGPAIAAAWTRWRARVRAVPLPLWLALAALLVLATVMLGDAAGRGLVVSEAIAQPDAILSLASHEWERLPATAALAARASSAKVLLTLPLRVNPWNCHDCTHRIDRLVAAGVARERIEVLPRRVYRTLDEAYALREWAERGGARSVVVVTSPYHTRRALASFRHVLDGSGVQLGMAPAASAIEPDRWWRHKYDRWYVAYEWRARLFYLVRFGIW